MKTLLLLLLSWNVAHCQTTDSLQSVPVSDTTDVMAYHPVPFADYEWAIYFSPEFTFSRGFQPGLQLGFGSFNSFAYGLSGLGLSGGIAYNIHREDLIFGGNIFGAAIAFFGGPNARLGVNYHLNSGQPFIGIKGELGLAITALFFNYSYERNVSDIDLPQNIHSFTLMTYFPAIRWNRKNKNNLQPIPY